MGLLQRLEAIKSAPKASGLIKKAEYYSFATKQIIEKQRFQKKEGDSSPLLLDESHVFFNDFTKKQGFLFGGILQLKNKRFSLMYSYKINEVKEFDSSKDFWDGLLSQENTWKLFEKKDFAPLYQFFSDNIENLSSIFFIKYKIEKNSYIVFFANKNNDKDAFESLKKNTKLKNFIEIIDELSNFYNIKKDFNFNTENYQNLFNTYEQAYCIRLSNKLFQNNKTISKPGLIAINKAFVKLFNEFLPQPGFCENQDIYFNLILFTQSKFDIDLFFTLLKKYFYEFFHYSTIDLFEVKEFKISKNIDEIESFLFYKTEGIGRA